MLLLLIFFWFVHSLSLLVHRVHFMLTQKEQRGRHGKTSGSIIRKEMNNVSQFRKLTTSLKTYHPRL
jgi:hypothetical protein